MLPAAALVSSAVLEMVSLFMSSSSTFFDWAFSDLVLAAFDGAESITSAEGIAMYAGAGGKSARLHADCTAVKVLGRASLLWDKPRRQWLNEGNSLLSFDGMTTVGMSYTFRAGNSRVGNVSG